MKIDVYSRAQAEWLDPIPGTVMISISQPEMPARLKAGWDDILRLEFYDMIKLMFGMDVSEMFNTTHVAAIYDFIYLHSTDKNFAVHCDAGMSRSVAVGMFLRDNNGGALELHAAKDTTMYNSRVHSGLMRPKWKELLCPQQ